MKDIRHWYIQKPISNNCPLNVRGAVFEEFMPTIREQNCEWVKVFSADDFHKAVNINITRYVDICSRLSRAEALLERAKHFVKLFSPQMRIDAENWLKDYEELRKG